MKTVSRPRAPRQHVVVGVRFWRQLSRMLETPLERRFVVKVVSCLEGLTRRKASQFGYSFLQESLHCDCTDHKVINRYLFHFNVTKAIFAPFLLLNKIHKYVCNEMGIDGWWFHCRHLVRHWPWHCACGYDDATVVRSKRGWSLYLDPFRSGTRTEGTLPSIWSSGEVKHK